MKEMVAKKSTEIRSVREFFRILEKNLPKGESISWSRLFEIFGRKDTGKFIVPLSEMELVKIDYKGNISIPNDKRGFYGK